jgi:transcriptional regulator GlxA family with amidase domain
MREVVMVGFEGVQLLDLAGPADVFDAASRIAGGTNGYRLTVATPGREDVRASCGVRVAADADVTALATDSIDTLLVAGSSSIEGPLGDRRLVECLQQISGDARRTSSVCSGAFLLAEARLLDGRRATTHWAGCAELANRYPEVKVEPDRIFVRDGNLVTSAGVTAGIDLALALVEEDHGTEVARTVARWLVVFLQRPGGQSQFSQRLEAPVPSESRLRSIVDGIVAHPGGDHRVPALAEQAALSTRQLTRLFIKEVQTTPGRFVERVRVEAARAQLEAGATSVEAIAATCGFGSPETMRRAFRRVLGIGPGEYRQRFGALGESPTPQTS